MNVLVDTNVVFDYLTKREPFSEKSTKVMQLCSEKKLSGYIAAHTILNLFFLLRKDIPETSIRRDILIELCEFMCVVSIDDDMLLRSLKKKYFKDFEDCVQAECAVRADADYIVTRNVKDFAQSPVKAVTPEELLEMLDEK